MNLRAFTAGAVALLAGCGDSPGAEPTERNLATQGDLLVDVAMSKREQEARRKALVQLGHDLEDAQRRLNAMTDGAVSFADMRTRLAALKTTPADRAKPARDPAPSDTSPPDVRVLGEIGSVFDRQYGLLAAEIQRFAPRGATGPTSLPAEDGMAVADLHYGLGDLLYRAAPASAARCKAADFDLDPRMPAGPTIAYASRADACSALLDALEKDWLRATAAALARECEVVKARVDDSAKQLEGNIGQKQDQLTALRDNLRASTSLDVLVTWGLPATTGVVLLLFAWVRTFREGIQKEIVSTRLLLDMVTVLLLITTILILGLSGKMDQEVLGTLIGGITGYTLGRAALGDGRFLGRGAQADSSSRDGGQRTLEKLDGGKILKVLGDLGYVNVSATEPAPGVSVITADRNGRAVKATFAGPAAAPAALSAAERSQLKSLRHIEHGRLLLAVEGTNGDDVELLDKLT